MSDDRFIYFTGEENEIEFLEKCLEQWKKSSNSCVSETRKIMEISTVFHEIRHRLTELKGGE